VALALPLALFVFGMQMEIPESCCFSFSVFCLPVFSNLTASLVRVCVCVCCCFLVATRHFHSYTRFARFSRALITIISLLLYFWWQRETPGQEQQQQRQQQHSGRGGGVLGGSHAYGLIAIDDLMWLDHWDLVGTCGQVLAGIWSQGFL